MELRNVFLCFLYFVAQVSVSEGGVKWNQIKCAPDADQTLPEGDESNIGRFPWLGIVQHEFYLGGKTRFAITAGILIHPGFVLSIAEDIAKIAPEQVVNNTKFIVWKSPEEKFSLDVNEYVLHPEYQEKETYASVALLELTNWVFLRVIAPVKPICLPLRGFGSFQDLYAVKLSDESKEIKKQVYKMNYIPEQDCEEFYYRAHLSLKTMAPSYPLCAVSERMSATCVWDGGVALVTRQNWGYWMLLSLKTMAPSYPLCAVSERMSATCVWDGGVALVTRQNWGYWMLLGFGVRGPGCGAPSRFMAIHKFLPWIDEVILYNPIEDLSEDETAFFLRQLSPITLTMYKADIKVPNQIGQCERSDRGGIIFKEADELLMNKNFGQGFYFVSVSQAASFSCAKIHLEVNSRTNAAVWIEHHCHREVTGVARGQRPPDYRKFECFLYFKSKAYIEFRFFFSFKAVMEISMYGHVEEQYVPNPFFRTETTDHWWPTDSYFEWGNFFPHRVWHWSM